MTQQPYQQGPPPGWTPQPDPNQPPPWAQPQAAPAQYPMFEPGAPSPFNQAGPAGPPPADDFGDIDEGTAAGDAPTIAQLAQSNRLVLIKPLRWKPGATKYKSDEPEEQAIADFIVCDGPPIAGHEEFASRIVTPFATGPKVAPFFIGGLMINKAVLDRVRTALQDPTRPAVRIGRLSANPPKNGGGFPWWNLEPATDADKAIARPIMARWAELEAAAAAGVPQQAAPAQQYAPPINQGPPPAWAQAPVQQGPPPGWGQAPAQPQYQQPPAPGGWNGQPTH